MIKVAALTGGRDKPSSRYRVRQHIEPLAALGVEVREMMPVLDKHWDLMSVEWQQRSPTLRKPVKVAQHFIKAAIRAPGFVESWRSDITWLQRELLPGIPSWEPVLKAPRVFDVDDAIWHAPPAGAYTSKKVAAWSDATIVGNDFLANWYEPFAKRIEIIPTAVDTVKWCPDPSQKTGKFTLGWIGTRPSLRYINHIEPALKVVMDRYPDVELVVVCDRPLEVELLPPERVRFVPWSRESELPSVQAMDVGIMPLIDEPWVYGKCSFKMLQYMACGLPVVVTPLAMNGTVLEHDDVGYGPSTFDEWVDALSALYEDRAEAVAQGLRGRAVVEARYGRDVVAKQIADLFKDLG
ncbi:MAG: glycosyltransferase family 4 protein [Deltaproteobacteria bacterium]